MCWPIVFLGYEVDTGKTEEEVGYLEEPLSLLQNEYEYWDYYREMEGCYGREFL